MEIMAKSKFIRMSPLKLRLVASCLGRNLSPAQALITLSSLNKAGALPLFKTVKQAIASATNNFALKEEDLRIKKIQVDGGPVMKRYRPVSRGMAHSILKRTSNITVVLTAPEKPEGTKTQGNDKNSQKGERNGS